MKYKLQDLIDIQHFQNLQDRLNKIYSFPSAIIDNDGNILTATAWQDICTKFHRKNEECEKHCIQSDQYILSHLHEANPAVSYRCPHGLVDNATPIIIDGVHYGNFFTGQFFLEAPDPEFFRRQAKKYGFDEDAYLEAVKKIPIWSQEQLDSYLFFIKGLIVVISESGLKNLKEVENRKLIEASEKRHRSILKSAMDAYWLTDTGGRLIEINDAYCRMSGYSENELLTMSIPDLEAVEDPQLVAEHMQKVVLHGSDRFESKHRRKDGTVFDVEISVQFRPEEGGQCVCFLRDISKRKQAELDLRQATRIAEEALKSAEDSNNIKNLAIEAAKAGTLFLDLKKDYLEWDKRSMDIFGVDADTFHNNYESWAQHVHKDDLEDIQHEIDRHIPSGKIIDIKYRIVRPDGELRHIWAVANIVRDDKGEPLSLTGMQFDITEQKQTEEALRESEARLLEAQRVGKIGSFMLDVTTGLWSGTDMLYPILGLETKREYSIEEWVETIHPDQRDDLAAYQQHVLEKKTAFDREYQVLRQSDGETIWVHSRGELQFDSNDNAIGMIGTTQDITERRHSEQALQESEKQYRYMFDQANEGLVLMTLDRQLHKVNQAFAEMHGYSIDELKCMDIRDLDILEERMLVDHDNIIRRMHAGETVRFEVKHYHKDGHSFPLSVTASMIEIEGKQYYQSFHQDITERKQVEEELRDSEERLGESARIAKVGGWEIDIQGNTLAWTEETFRIHELDNDLPPNVDEAIQFYHPDDRAKVAAAVEDAVESGEAFDFEARLITAKKNQRWVRSIGKALSLDGRLIGIRGMVQDITERKQVEEALRENEAYIKAVMDNLPIGVAVNSVDPDVVFSYTNDNFAKFYRTTREALSEPDAFWDSVYEDPVFRDKMRKRVLADCASDDPKRMHWEDVPITRQGKETAFISARNTPVPRKKLMISTVWDVTERKQAEANLKWELSLNKVRADISKELLSQHYNIKKISEITLDYARELTNSRHGFVSSIEKGTLENVVHTRTDMFGKQCTEKEQRIAFPIGPDGKYEALWGHALNIKKPFFTNQPKNHSRTKGLPEGHIPLINYLGVPVLIEDKLAGLIALANSDREYTEMDIEAVERLADIFALALYRYQYELEKENFEKQLQQMQKLESIGNLAGGIAHDFNNILTPIVGMSELLIEDLPTGSHELENAQVIIEAGKRGSDLVAQILSFSRQTEHEVIPVRIQRILKEVLKLGRSTIPSDIEIAQDIQNDCGMVMADPTQLHQIAMNLITNAYHAIEQNAGTISVKLKETILGPEDSADSLLEPGRYAVLSVSDTGCGIDPLLMNKIFDPYFTTKGQGKGTGLGLAVVYGIVKEYHGDINVSSELGEGTTFNVYLPLMENFSETVSVEKVEKYEPGTERILLVDDEEPVARLEKQMLERLGYRVTSRTNSLEALEVFKANPADFDLVVTDMTMPNMTGSQLARELISVKPDIPIIICTGFSERISKEKAPGFGIKGFLMKPIIKSDMAKMVRKVINEAKNET